MATSEDTPFSLRSLEDELTCSICLSPFDCPVTIPCGHNFCQSCLLATWKGTYSCPQCRTHFSTKPELKKNTVLSTVVETFNLSSNKSDVCLLGEEQEAELKDVIRCDTCMEAEASQTCLTCMASFCEEHLRPHRENPNFAVHQLSEPVRDLSQRICTDHHKLMELFCKQHVRPICSLCLQLDHKGCPFTSPEEQRTLKECELRDKMSLLEGKIEKSETVMFQMNDAQSKLKVILTSFTRIKGNFGRCVWQVRDILAQEESKAQNEVDHELEIGQTKLRDLDKKLNDNSAKMRKAKEDINCLLSSSQTLAFLKTSFNLPKVTKFEPNMPQINLDSKKVTATLAFAGALKVHLTEILEQPVETRLPITKPGECACEIMMKPIMPYLILLVGRGIHLRDGNSNFVFKASSVSLLTNDFLSSSAVETSNIPSNITSAEKRSDLLKYGTALTLDPKTAHRRIILSEEFTKASVTDEQENYPNCPQRFAVCSQVLTSQSFSRGRHYWEVRLSCNNFIGIGLAYRSIDRKGPNSRLGRNAQSWCVEWFNVKLSAWHNSSETVLANVNPKRVGVLLDLEGGVVTFYNVSDRAYPFHCFALPFTEAVFPAFWMFSSGSSISLCKLE
uniref:Tripartite motif containing 25 n=1 Tax=Scophthalmus maximus TaxID=52904 RepID=A0A8D3AMV6_SCOMX